MSNPQQTLADSLRQLAQSNPQLAAQIAEQARVAQEQARQEAERKAAEKKPKGLIPRVSEKGVYGFSAPGVAGVASRYGITLGYAELLAERFADPAQLLRLFADLLRLAEDGPVTVKPGRNTDPEDLRQRILDGAERLERAAAKIDADWSAEEILRREG